MNEAVRKYMKKIGKTGGTATKERHGTDHFSKAGKKGAQARRKKVK